MNLPEKALVDYLTQIKDRKIGFTALRTNVGGWSADIELDARYDWFTSECIFDDCDDEQAKIFLEAFVGSSLSVGGFVCEQLSKLLASRGNLVREMVDPLLTTLNWSSWAGHLLFLSYLATRDDGAVLAGRLLDEVPEDGRDGLFLACHRLQSEELDKKLIRKFEEWGAEGWDGKGTGELHALEQFIAKWLPLYPYSELEGVIRLYFRHRRAR